MPNTLKIQGNLTIQGGLFLSLDSTTKLALRWTGLGSNNNYSTASNWNVGYAPSINDFLIFAGSTRLTPFNDLAANTPVSGITFAVGASSFTLSGNSFELRSGGITNNSSNTQTINNNIILGTNAGTINCATSAINLNGNISGSGSFTKLGTSLLTLSGNNSYTGDTFISAGDITIGNSNPFGTGIVNISGAGGRFTVDSSSIPSTVVINNTLNFISNPTINFNKTTTLNGPINFSGTIVSLRNNIQNNIVTFNNTISASTGVQIFSPFCTVGSQMIFNSPVILQGTTSFQADTTDRGFFRFNATGNRLSELRGAGWFICGISNAFSSQSMTVRLLGRIDLNGTDQVLGRLTNEGSTYVNVSGANIFNNSTTFSNLSCNTISNATYTGSISGNINLIKLGSFTQTLSGNMALGVGPRYTGFTAISAGTLRNYALSSNPSNKVNYADFQPTSLVVNFTTPPTVGDAFILLPGRTINSYSTGGISYTNGGGLRGTYDSRTSTLSVIPAP